MELFTRRGICGIPSVGTEKPLLFSYITTCSHPNDIFIDASNIYAIMTALTETCYFH
jgi:hypothetical protein